MMKVYELSEFIFLLRLGLWSGGEIASLGYVTAARNADGDGGIAGLGGIWLGSGITLEHSRPNPSGETELTFSIYEPYTGEYRFLAVAASCGEDIERLIFTITEEAERTNRRGARKPQEHESLQSKRRYIAQHSSPRSGAVPTTRRNR